jgi:hypothetical protein
MSTVAPALLNVMVLPVNLTFVPDQAMHVLLTLHAFVTALVQVRKTINIGL